MFYEFSSISPVYSWTSVLSSSVLFAAIQESHAALQAYMFCSNIEQP